MKAATHHRYYVVLKTCSFFYALLLQAKVIEEVCNQRVLQEEATTSVSLITTLQQMLCFAPVRLKAASISSSPDSIAPFSRSTVSCSANKVCEMMSQKTKGSELHWTAQALPQQRSALLYMLYPTAPQYRLVEADSQGSRLKAFVTVQAPAPYPPSPCF